MLYPVPLPNSGKSIRLLSIKASATNSAQIETTLWQAEIHGNTSYEALSYCWGQSGDSETISVNGEPMQVRRTLATALRSLRYHDQNRVIWVDAICINQEDVNEKNHQVPLMPHIYANCTTAVIWLGVSDHDAQRTFRSLRKDSSKYSSPFTRLLRRPWFRRVWVIQEIAHAPKAVVKCGDDEMEWYQFYQPISKMKYVRKALYLSRQEGEAFVHPAFYPQVMDEARQTIQSGRRFGILEALRIFRPFSATLPIDKVYGIIGLLKEPELVKVDYGVSAVEVYASVASTIMRMSRSLDVFLDCTQRKDGPKLEGLPSWAPDWSDVVAFQASTPEIEAIPFTASQRSHLDPEFFENDKGNLHLSGLIVATVEELGTYPPSLDELRAEYWPYGRTLPRKHALKALRLLTDHYRSGQKVACRVNGASGTLQDSYATNETMIEAYYNALDVNAPWSEVHSSKTAELKNFVLEYCLKTIESFNASPVARLPWQLALPLAGPFFALASLVFVARLSSTSRELLAGSSQSQETTQQDMFGRQATVGRTDTGWLGVFPSPFLTSPDTLPTAPGDSVVLFKGSAIPCIIRRVGKQWRLIGPAYIYGIMYGGAFEEDKCEPIHLI